MTRTLEQLDPATLIVGENIRGDARLDPAFLASIAEEGVLEAVDAYRDDQDQIVVLRGKRRTLAACHAGLESIPVLVDDTPPGDVDRVVHQLVENDQRAGLTNVERVRAVEQLALLGVPAGQIARRTSLSKDQVAAAAKIARSDTAIAHVDDAGVTLDQVAILAEFEGDERATTQLAHELQWGSRANLAATAQRIRDDRAEKDVIAAKAAELVEQGVEVVERPEYGQDTRAIAKLTNLASDSGAKLTPKRHEKCPGHRVWVELDYRSSRGEGIRVAIVPACADWPSHGHIHEQLSNRTGGVPTDQLTEEERDAERRKRKHVVESNKDWRAATTVRRQWLTQFTPRKTAPDGAEAYIAAAVLAGGLEHAALYVSEYDVRDRAFAHLGTGGPTLRSELATATPKRALHIVLVLVLGAWEDSLPDDAWRAGHARDATVRALQAISQWGHQLSDIEQRIIDGTAMEPKA